MVRDEELLNVEGVHTINTDLAGFLLKLNNAERNTEVSLVEKLRVV